MKIKIHSPFFCKDTLENTWNIKGEELYDFFEQELRNFFAKDNIFDDVKLIGKVCYGTLGEKTRMKLEFVTLGTYQKYERIRATVLDKTDGQIDVLTLKSSDVWGKKKLNNLNFRDGIEPYIWIYNGEAEWYSYKPTLSDYKEMSSSVSEYVQLFKGQTMVHKLISLHLKKRTTFL